MSVQTLFCLSGLVGENANGIQCIEARNTGTYHISMCTQPPEQRVIHYKMPMWISCHLISTVHNR